MSMTTPVEPLRFEQYWFYPNLFPKTSVILLDGATGVGKSMFCAHLASRFAHNYQGDKRILTLYITSDKQSLTRNRHLGHQQATGDFIAHADFNDCLKDVLQSTTNDLRSVLNAFETWLNQLLEETKPAVVILDDFEEMVQHINDKLPKHLQGEWWSILRYAAYRHCCSFIVPRRKGMNIARHYGAFNTTGTEYTDFILTMHWHPHDPKKRVISVAKNTHGPIGMQWHLHFDPLGTTTLHEMEEHQHVRPSKVPQTWKADPGLVNCINRVADEIKDYMGAEDKPIQELKEHFKAKHYSERVIDNAIGLMGIQHTRKGETWCYQPSQSMFIALRRKYYEDLRTRAAQVEAILPSCSSKSNVTTETAAHTHCDDDAPLPTPSTLKPEYMPDLRTHDAPVAA